VRPHTAIALATLVTGLFACVLIHAASTRGYVWLLQSDAQHFFGVALDPFGSGTTLSPAPGVGTAYRYGRIAYPLLAWLLAGGHAAWIVYTLPIVYLAGVWLLVWLASGWCVTAGRSAFFGLTVGPVVGAPLPHLVPEALIAGLILLMYRYVARGHTQAAYAVAAMLLLARETAVLALVPLVIVALHSRQYRRARSWGSTALPLLFWYAWLRYRMGCWPFLDPGANVNQPLDLPIRGFLALAWTGSPISGAAGAALAGWLTIGLAAWTAWRARTVLAYGALSMALIIVCFGAGQATMPFEAMRLMGPMITLLLLAAVTKHAHANAVA